MLDLGYIIGARSSQAPPPLTTIKVPIQAPWIMIGLQVLGMTAAIHYEVYKHPTPYGLMDLDL
ncbi:hypothetical protein N7507_006855 [Penicillium longicatenatum]|nr:hypothetical protein N7507_006855 [Penicillium longicatenatum]